MKRQSAVALWIATAAVALVFTQFASAQTAPSNTNPCSMQETVPAYYVGGYYFSALLAQPCTATQQAAPSDYTSSAAEQNANSTDAKQTAMQMVPAQALLAQSVDATKVKPGESIKATLNSKVQLKDGPELPSGTELTGRVSVDQMQDGSYRLAMVFTDAQVKGGRAIPIKATIVGVHAPVIFDSLNAIPLDLAYPIKNNWNEATLQVNQPNVLGGVDLQSWIAGNSSGDFVSNQKDDIRLAPDSVLNLAIAEQGKS